MGFEPEFIAQQLLSMRRWVFLPVAFLFWLMMAPVVLLGDMPNDRDTISGIILAAATTIVWLVGIPWIVKMMRDGR